MFAKNVPTGGISSKEAETIIGASVKVEGNFVCEGNMIIDGEVKGQVETNGFLQVGERATIEADVKAAHGKVAGNIKGNVKVGGYLELTASAKITGDVEAETLSVAKGALLNGHCTMKAEGKSKKEKNNQEAVPDAAA